MRSQTWRVAASLKYDEIKCANFLFLGILLSQPITWLNPYRHRPFSSWLDSIFIKAKEKPWTKILHSKGIFHPSHAKAACYMESAHVQSRAPHHGLTFYLLNIVFMLRLGSNLQDMLIIIHLTQNRSHIIMRWKFIEF